MSDDDVNGDDVSDDDSKQCRVAGDCLHVTRETVLPVTEAASDGDMYRLVTFSEPTSCSVCKKLLRWLLSSVTVLLSSVL